MLSFIFTLSFTPLYNKQCNTTHSVHTQDHRLAGLPHLYLSSYISLTTRLLTEQKNRLLFFQRSSVVHFSRYWNWNSFITTQFNRRNSNKFSFIKCRYLYSLTFVEVSHTQKDESPSPAFTSSYLPYSDISPPIRILLLSWSRMSIYLFLPSTSHIQQSGQCPVVPNPFFQRDESQKSRPLNDWMQSEVQSKSWIVMELNPARKWFCI